MTVFIDPNIADTVAHLSEVNRAVEAAAKRAGEVASGVLSQHHHSGDAKITVTKGDKTDWFVNLDDTAGTGRGHHAAAAIEYGHMAPDGTFVDGIHALTRSFK
jgi:hypothetical protein